MNPEANFNHISVLVLGFDSYKDSWPYFDYFFKKNGTSDVFEKKVFVSVSELFQSKSGFCSFSTGGRSDFSSRLKTGLEQIRSPYVLLLLEDYLLSEPLDGRAFGAILSEMQSGHYVFCELQNFIKKPRLLKKESFLSSIREVASPGHYRISMQPAIWETNFLRKLAENPLDKPWDFETLLCHRFDETPNGQYPKAGFAKNSSFRVVNLIDKGKITPSSLSLIRTEKLPIPTRKSLSRLEFFKMRSRVVFSNSIPLWLRKKLKKIGGHFGRHYFSED